ncbi:plant expansin-like protein [Sclerotinia borealis F-4128]|uniref:Plant expansin-like protein n=1 Tax=Sclerotinia borealis (strain F-4128) TaxID=1432307 RepID=W9C4Y4_SCLBF|nr:plant expansin-like protein [Sclerotinia borealis F-4128]
MQFRQTLTLLTLLTSTQAIQVTYDPGYDNASHSLDAVACSNGENGLETRFPAYKVQGDLPTFARIGGASTIAGWNSPNCGTCYSLSYQGVTINILAIDHADIGFNIAESAMNTLTKGRAVELGNVDAEWTLLTPEQCGLPTGGGGACRI